MSEATKKIRDLIETAEDAISAASAYADEIEEARRDLQEEESKLSKIRDDLLYEEIYSEDEDLNEEERAKAAGKAADLRSAEEAAELKIQLLKGDAYWREERAIEADESLASAIEAFADILEGLEGLEGDENENENGEEDDLEGLERSLRSLLEAEREIWPYGEGGTPGTDKGSKSLRRAAERARIAD